MGVGRSYYLSRQLVEAFKDSGAKKSIQKCACDVIKNESELLLLIPFNCFLRTGCERLIWLSVFSFFLCFWDDGWGRKKIKEKRCNSVLRLHWRETRTERWREKIRLIAKRNLWIKNGIVRYRMVTYYSKEYWLFKHWRAFWKMTRPMKNVRNRNINGFFRMNIQNNMRKSE